MLSSAKVSAALPAADFERAKSFYTEKLGFKPSHEDEGGVVFDCAGSTSFYLYPSEFAGSNKATAASFDVDDMDTEMKDLKAKGVQFEEYDMPGLKTENGVASWGDYKAAWFKDSEGNIIALGQKVK